MSARERLVEQLRNPGLVGLDELDASEMVDAFAYELAKVIRDERKSMEAEAIPEHGHLLEGMSYAADTIDPLPGD